MPLLLMPLRGQTSLWKVFWLYGLATNAVVAIGARAFLPHDTSGMGPILFVGLLIGVYQLVALWRCAFNCQSRSLGLLIRTAVGASLLALPIFIYVIWTAPG